MITTIIIIEFMWEKKIYYYYYIVDVDSLKRLNETVLLYYIK